jgi:hypothetical protein
MLAAPDRKTGRLASIVAVGFVVTACAVPAGGPGSSAPLCTAMLTFRGQVYVGTTLRGRLVPCDAVLLLSVMN